MKRIIFSLVAVVLLVACAKKETTPAYQTFKALQDSLYIKLQSAQSAEEFNTIVEQFTTESYDLVMNNLEDTTIDSILLNTNFFLSFEQKEAIYSALPAEQMQGALVQKMYKNYQIEKATSPGNKYIDIASLQPNGEKLALSDLVGKTDYVLVDFWASWCGPCRRLIPALKELYAKYNPKGRLEILGVSCDQDEQAWLKAIEEDGMKWKQIRDQREEPYNPSDVYGIVAIPTTYLIDREGTILFRNPKEAEIDSVLAQK